MHRKTHYFVFLTHVWLTFFWYMNKSRKHTETFLFGSVSIHVSDVGLPLIYSALSLGSFTVSLNS